jgi:hypothetical protein
MNFKYILAFTVFVFTSFALSAQVFSSSDSTKMPQTIVNTMVKKPKPITKETSFGARIHNDGWTVFFESGSAKAKDMKRIEKFHDVRIFQVEFSERRHPKELRMIGWDIDKASDKKYTFAKLNTFYALKFNYGNRKMIAGKPFGNSVSVHWVYAGGVALGFLKPYYVDAYVSKDGGQTFERENIKYSPEVSEYFLNPVYIVGSSGFTQGLGELKIKPGLHLKTALHFDYAKDKFLVSAAEIGGTAEFYSSKIELMANQKAVPYFFNIYASLQFGKRKR